MVNPGIQVEPEHAAQAIQRDTRVMLNNGLSMPAAPPSPDKVNAFNTVWAQMFPDSRLHLAKLQQMLSGSLDPKNFLALQKTIAAFPVQWSVLSKMVGLISQGLNKLASQS